MALLFCDSVRHYSTTARILEKWSTNSGVTVNATQGRNNGPILSIGAINVFNAIFVSKTISASVATLGVGFRFKQNNGFSSSGTTYPVLAFRDGTSGQCMIALTATGALQAYQGNYSTTIGSPSVNTLAPNTLYHIEAKVLIHGSTGALEVRVNGTSTGWLNLADVDTQATANATCNNVFFGNSRSADGGGDRFIGDVVIWDTSGSVNNDFLGEVNVDAYLPTGAGHYAQFTPSAGANWQCVDEADPNTTDYVSSSTAGHKDSYAFADMIGNNPQIKAVVNNLWALKTDSGTVYAKSVAVTGPTDSPPTEYAGANLTPSTTYTCLQHFYETNPATAAAWTKAEFNAAEFGVEIATS